MRSTIMPLYLLLLVSRWRFLASTTEIWVNDSAIQSSYVGDAYSLVGSVTPKSANKTTSMSTRLLSRARLHMELTSRYACLDDRTMDHCGTLGMIKC